MNDWEKTTREEARVRALDLMTQRDRPVLVGEVALACGTLWGLEDAELLLEELESEKLIERVPGSLVQYERVKSSEDPNVLR